MAKNILLINPPSPFLLDERVFLPLAHAQLSAVAEQKGHKVDVLDLAGVTDYIKVTLDKIGMNPQFDSVGISATTPQFQHAFNLLNEIKKSFPSLYVSLGGAHATVMGNLRKTILLQKNSFDVNFEALEKFDSIIEGEGEVLIDEAFTPGNKWVGPGMVPVDPNTKYLIDLPFPDREKFDFGSYKWKLQDKNGEFHKGTNVMDQRGCPYGCYFCSGRSSPVYRKARQRRPEHILAELDELHSKYGLNAFMFYDDEFNVNQKYTLELCKALEKRNYVLRGFIKSELFVRFPEVAEAMSRAGFVEVCTGVESGSERLLKNYILKNTTPEINFDAAVLAKKNEMRFKVFTLLGHPTETEKDVMETKQWIINAGETLGNEWFDFDVTINQPYPGSPCYDQSVFTGRYEDGKPIFSYRDALFFKKTNFSDPKECTFYKGVPGEYQSHVWTKEISRDRFVELRDAIDKDIRQRLGMKQITR